MAFVILDPQKNEPDTSSPLKKKKISFANLHLDEQESNFITQAYPYKSDGEKYILKTTLDKNGRLNSAPENRNGVLVYFTNEFPLTIKNPFLMYSLPRVYDLYNGISSPFNLHHPTNYKYGMNPFINSQYMPRENLSEPFTSGFYEGFNHRDFTNSNKFPISPIIPMDAPVMNGGTFGTNPKANPRPFGQLRNLGLLPFGPRVRI